ncbi:hypothetical protein LTR91_018946 [Friedmanniomyces endolithicus]|uniref:Uncharacterized protein n=1 Tax=Friedmanniomyces endolithicus TaxID=329885 RepID=A0AAN6HBW6_9PEZI|nr:hypothetical protein LTR57_020774 [Friedmanniomyces endolithicus]KAK0957459.1 hypothetical protein LTS01_022363 [Friedmanniomyces endolithicus]KAK0963525.1 hypothetical protein LTR91_018946 [Friedmanniomyces endolithicus]KAK1031049.1 hypothetical protein LTS16_018355 [Friedmanniomyces endolithicus]
MCQQTYAICLLCHYPNLEILITFTECNEFREGIPPNHSASRDRMRLGILWRLFYEEIRRDRLGSYAAPKLSAVGSEGFGV